MYVLVRDYSRLAIPKFSCICSSSTSFIDFVGNKTTYGNDEFWTNDGWSSLPFQDGDSFLEEILGKMEVVHSHVLKLKARINKLVTENPGKFSSVNKRILVSCDAFASSTQSPPSPPDIGNRLSCGSLYTDSQHTSEHNIRDLLMIESAVSSHGEVAPHPDMIESTDHHQVGGLYKNVSFSIVKWFSFILRCWFRNVGNKL